MRCPRSRTGCSTKCARRCESLGHDLERIAAEEEDPGLGNGGLGRLAACFLDSLATLGYAATGYGIRYDYGIFTQVIGEDGAQREVASSWLGLHNFWESGHGGVRYRVRFGGHCHATRDEQGRIRYEWVDTQDVWAVGYDLLIPGNRSPTVNHLRLWSGRAITPFQDRGVQRRQLRRRGRRADRREESVARAVSGRLDAAGQGAALQAAVLLRQRIAAGHARAASRGAARSSRICRSAIAIQLNDTHPALTIVELMRLLVDVYDLRMGRSRGRSRATSAATPITRCCRKRSRPGRSSFFERLLPRHLQIVYQINRDFLEEVSAQAIRTTSIAAAACR